MREVRTMVRIMAMDITQSTMFVGAKSLGVLACGGGRSRGFGDHRFRECDFNHGLDMGQLRTSMGGMTDTITQGTRLGGWGRGRVGCGGLVFGCPLASFSFLAHRCRGMRMFLRRGLGHCSSGRSDGD